jgi:hypothetical protein
MKKILWLAVTTWLVLAGTRAMAIDGVAVEAGSGDGTDMGRIAVQWDWNKRWFESKEWHLGGYWDLGLGQWHKGSAGARNSNITEVGITPVLRFQRNNLEGGYAELGVGAHFLSDTTIGDKTFGSSFQFGDHVGVGYRFGAKRAFDLSYRYQHLSNAGIKKPNNGINFSQIRLQYHF